MGTGHIMRCLALAQAWKGAGGRAAFASESSISDIVRHLDQECFPVHHIKACPGSKEDAALTAELADSIGACFVVVDGYQFDAEYQKALVNAGQRLLVIDDNGHAKFYWAELVLNQNIYANEDLYRKRDCKTRLLLGPDYVLLRQEFWSMRGRLRSNPDRVGKILVTLGGSDPGNVTLKIINALREIDLPESELTVVVGAGNANIDALTNASNACKIPLKILKNVSDMAELMASADIAIISGGTTSYETAFMGLPSLIVIIADNQIAVAEKMAEIKAAVNLGWHTVLTCEKIRMAFVDLADCRASRDSFSRKGSELVDGLGCSRVVSVMLERVITVRDAVADDCNLIFQWANDDDTRAASFSSGKISSEEHCDWFSDRLADANCLLLICSDGRGDPLGAVRFDISDDEATVSINLAPHVRGQGWGSFIIIRTTDELFRQRDISRVNAFIKPENQRSVRAFELAGFSKIGPCRIKENDALHFTLNNEDLSHK
jgi:UDP-2,4-diacetamido-2,4,6-trideoxy-beta-L-altropyranose hydrolase